MADEPKIVFMNQNPGVVDWFYRGPSKVRAEELGWDIRFNETGGALDAEQWAEMVADCNALLTTWGSPKIDNAILAKNDSLRIVAHVGGSVAAIVSDDLYDRGVRVSTANPLMARSVAEHCIMLMLMGTRRAHDHIKLGTRSETMRHYKDWHLGLRRYRVLRRGHARAVRAEGDPGGQRPPLRGGRRRPRDAQGRVRRALPGGGCHLHPRRDDRREHRRGRREAAPRDEERLNDHQRGARAAH